MRRKSVSALVPAALILHLSSAWAAAPDRELRARWEEAVEPQSAKIVIQNLDTRPAEASLGSQQVAIPATGTVEIPAAAAPFRSQASLLVLQAADGFDASSLRIEKIVEPRLQAKAAVPAHPAWARELAAGVEHIRHGATGAAGIVSKDPDARAEIAVEFLAPHTLVRIRQLDTLGNELTSLVASSSSPVRWRATLEPVAGGSRIEMQTLRGEAQGTAAATRTRGRRSPIKPLLKVGGGNARFDPTINWRYSSNLYYRVTGGPANTCGDLYVSRNGSAYAVTPGWICTDASGNATKGAWTWAGQSGDEFAIGYIVWSDGTSTNSASHTWDKNPPSVTMSSNGGVPAPTAVSGTANDGNYGSGFSAAFPADAGGGSSACVLYFYDKTAGWYYCGGSYGSQFPCNPSCTISGMPSRSVTWSAGSSVLPPGYAHTSGHCYEWGVYIWDNGTYGQSNTFPATYTFCVP
jgi:hypothetical protein